MPNIATKWILFGGAFIIATAGKSKELEINGQIRDREVRLIGADGEQKGVVSIQVAMRAAEDAGLDLVKSHRRLFRCVQGAGLRQVPF